MSKSILIKITMVMMIIFNLKIFAENTLPINIKPGIEKIIKQYELPATIGMQVQSMHTGKIIYSRNATHLFVPASNLKLFTAAAVLLYLKPDYQIPTLLVTDAQTINHGILQGNVYIKFNEDPSLTTNQLNELISVLKQNKVATIAGNFYIDDSHIQDKKYGPGWMWDDLNTCYSSPITAVMINQNCFKALLITADKAGNPARLKLGNYNNLTPITNKVRTVSANVADCPLELAADGNNNYLLTGCRPIGSKPLELNIAIKNPELYASNLIKFLLQNNDILLQGQIKIAVAPTNLKILAIKKSQPLINLVKEMLKDSNDQIADALIMILAEDFYHQPASWQKSIKALQAILLQQANLDLSKANIVDGAGISRYNLVTPQQISQLLYFAYHNSAIAPDFIAALPIAGRDGTLKDRMANGYLQNKLLAKTGTMIGASSLSGYVLGTNKETLSFTILINNFLPSDKARVEELEDQIGKFLAQIN